MATLALSLADCPSEATEEITFPPTYKFDKHSQEEITFAPTYKFVGPVGPRGGKKDDAVTAVKFDAVKFHPGPLQGGSSMAFDPRSRPWTVGGCRNMQNEEQWRANPGIPLPVAVQEQWKSESGGGGEYSFSGPGGNMDWPASGGIGGIGGGYWQEQWRANPGLPIAVQEQWRTESGGEGPYTFSGQGGNMDWPAGWQMPMAMNDGWQNRNRKVDTTKGKRRFCTSYPDVSQCRRGTGCAFAHCREEICVPLLSVEEENQEPHALTDEFFMYKYKMSWCPIGVQHEWHTCVYAHNYQDARRPVDIGYGARLCPYWSKKDTGAEYSQRCPLGLRCPYSHGAKEQLYHPHYFKTVVCRDLRGKACPRHKLCAFYHHRHERRPTPADEIDYSKPLPLKALPKDWVKDFLSPPFHVENGKPKMEDGKDKPTPRGGPQEAP